MNITIKHKTTGAVLFTGDTADLYGANLTGADLTRANLYGANLYGADLTRANLTGANLTGANLICANLTGANLTGTNLTGANLTGANLICANLIRADLTDAKFASANLQQTKGIVCVSCSFTNLGELGRQWSCIKVAGINTFFCGCFTGPEEELRARIEAGPIFFKKTRLFALSFLLEAMKIENP